MRNQIPVVKDQEEICSAHDTAHPANPTDFSLKKGWSAILRTVYKAKNIVFIVRPYGTKSLNS